MLMLHKNTPTLSGFRENDGAGGDTRADTRIDTGANVPLCTQFHLQHLLQGPILG